MPTFPTELITLLGSSLIGSGTKLAAGAAAARRRERELSLRAHRRDVREVREHSNVGFQWTRRAIALIAVFCIVALPKLIAIWRPDIAIHIGYPELKDGFLFFSSSSEKIRWARLEGFVLTPLDTHLLSAIVGLYFGGSLAEHSA